MRSAPHTSSVRQGKNMNITFKIQSKNLQQFIEHWSSKYFYKDEDKYNRNIGKPFTEESRTDLFEWKNGSVISQKKTLSILKNYPLTFQGNVEERYLDHKKSGGAIWNIFYLHCLDSNKWPIFDQHTFRAMRYLQLGEIHEIGNSDKQKYEYYQSEYIPFIGSLGDIDHRTLDKALFAFGQFLKKTKKYV